MVKTIATNYSFKFKLKTLVNDNEFKDKLKIFKIVVTNYGFVMYKKLNKKFLGHHMDMPRWLIEIALVWKLF